MDKEQSPAVDGTAVPQDVQDQIVVARIRSATPPNIARAADLAHTFYYGDETDRTAVDLALGDALGVDQSAFTRSPA